MKKLCRSRRNRVIAGVAGGVAVYFDVDVILVRLLFVLASFYGGSGVLVYIVAWMIMPEEKASTTGDEHLNGYGQGHWPPSDPLQVREKRQRYAGLVLVGLGVFLLLRQLIPWNIVPFIWPLLLIIIGFLLVAYSKKE